MYAAYGRVFIVLSLVWGRFFDGFEPDRWNLVGAAVCLLGGSIMYFAPRLGRRAVWPGLPTSVGATSSPRHIDVCQYGEAK